MNGLSRSQAGFSLLELLVVIGIVAVILAAVVAARPRASAARVMSAGRSVAATLEIARARAMSSNAETVVLIDTAKGQFGQPNAMHSLPRGISVRLTVAEPERVGREGGLRFYPDGQSSGGEIILTLDGKVSRISVDWLTGQPRLGS